MSTEPEVTPEMAILGAWYNQQVETLTAVATAIESLARDAHRAEVRIKMRHKRPKLRKGTKVNQPMRRYTRENPDMKWLLP